MRHVDIDSLILASVKLIASNCKGVNVKTKLNSGTWAVAADRMKLEQAFVNLLTNAHRALPQDGILTINTAKVDLADTLVRHNNLPVGPYIRITVADHVAVRDAFSQRTVYEPINAPEVIAEGTVEGLSSLYHVIASHLGFIEINRQDNENANLTIYLPAIKRRPEVTGKVDASHVEANTVLLVDDEALIRKVTSRMIERLGYRVIPAVSGEEATELYDPQKIDLVVLDIVMPGMGGAETFDRLRQTDPYAKVLLVSGYSRSKVVAGILRRGAMGFLHKPYSVKELSGTLGAILEEPH